MEKEKILEIYKLLIIALGIAACLFALYRLDGDMLTLPFIALSIFAVTIASRLNLKLTHTNQNLTFADAMIFLTFLLYGGELAILLASVETLFNCSFIQRKGFKFARLMIPFNVGATAVSTSVSYFVWLGFPVVTGKHLDLANTSDMISLLCMLSLAQFSTQLAVGRIFSILRDPKDSSKRWTESFLQVSITQIAGAGMAGIIYKLISYGDILATTLTLVLLSIGYLTYRQSIKEMNQSFEEAEQAQKEKAAAEKMRAEQAEKHVGELSILLEEQEKISMALQQSKDAFRHAAMHDSLTKLPNRAYLFDKLRLLIEKNHADLPHYFCVLFLDLSRFNGVNDSLGHSIGDKLLVAVSERLCNTVGKEDVVSRLGGDEFVIILTRAEELKDAINMAQSIQKKISQPFSIEGNRIFTGIRIGIADFEKEYRTPEEILRDADLAMKQAKEKGLSYAVFDKELRSRVLNKIQLESDLHLALEQDELSMFYQPLISLKNDELIGFEALLRWRHPSRGFIPPAQFIPIAEKSGLIIPITEWLLRETAQQLSKWQKLSEKYSGLIVSVNISGKHLTNNDLIGHVKKTVRAARISPETLKLELTESTAMENVDKTIHVLSKLKETGVQLSIDDFGTGYSSLSQLHKLPFDTLKIDRSFVNNSSDRSDNSQILNTIISLAHNLKMRVIAEGIETPHQLELLRKLGCNYGQGYLISKPLPADAMQQLLQNGHEWVKRKAPDMPAPGRAGSNEKIELGGSLPAF